MVTKGEIWCVWGEGGGWGGSKSGAWEEGAHTTMYKIDTQQGLTV